MSDIFSNYRLLLCRLYNLSIDTTDIPLNFISFKEASDLIRSGQIVNHEVRPVDQVLSDLENSHRIITLYGSSGLEYLLKANYNPATKQIYP